MIDLRTLKVKELKDDAILSIKVNKSYYTMAKAAVFVVFKDLYALSGDPEKFVKAIITKEYKDMTDKERLFYTLTLLVGEIEKQALENNAFDEKELDLATLKEELNKKASED